MREVIDAVFDRTLTLLDANRDLLEETSRALLERETLDDADLSKIAEPVE